MVGIEHTTSETHLPEGWAAATLNDLIGEDGVLTDGDWIESKDQNPDGNIRLIQLSDIGDGFYRNRSNRFLTSQTAKELGCTFLEAGDLLIARMPEPLGRACIFPGDSKKCVTAVDICIARTGCSQIDHHYLMYVINMVQTRRHIEALQRGTTRKRISRKNLISIELPLAPPLEQKRIVTKTDKLLARVDLARQRLANVPAILKRFRQSVLAAAYSGRLTEDWREKHTDIEPAAELIDQIRKKRKKSYETACKEASENGLRKPKKPANLNIKNVDTSILPGVPDKWHWVYLPELGELNRGKSRHRPRNAEHLYGGSYPFIQTGEIARSGGRIINHTKTYSDAGLAQSRLWPAETICITIAANIADSAILTYSACFPDSVVGLITEQSLCLNKYAEFFIRTAHDDLSQFAPATAQKNINLGILSEVAVPLPPFEEQQEIVRRVEELFALAEKIENRVKIATARADKMTQSILAKAFRGRLVPTEAELAKLEGRDYETAQQLLQRIENNNAQTRK